MGPVTVVRAVTGSLPALLLLTLTVGCGVGESAPTVSQSVGGAPSEPGNTASGMPSTPPPAPRRLTPEADGNHYSMTVGSTTTLVVRGEDVDQPEVDGTSVILVSVVNVTDSGVREWEVRGVRPGTAIITSGTPAYRITITVG